MRKLPEIITEKELINIISKTKSKKHQTAFLLGFYQCMRVSEVVNLKPTSVDTHRKLIMIKEAKGKKDRNIPIAPELIRGLKKKLPIKIGVRALQIAFKKRAKEVLNKDLHFHSLRHSGATHYLNQKKWNMRQLQNFLGHSRLDTVQIYTHISPQDLIEQMWGKE